MRGLAAGVLAAATGAAMLVAANFALSGHLAWTPGGTGVAFGRMMQDGIVAQYLRDHCSSERLKLCPYRDTLPATADEFLWGHSMFDELGRFQGMNDEMGFIVRHSLAEYPLWQAGAAIKATARQLLSVATGEGTNGWIPHTYGIIERYIPSQLVPMRAAHQQHWDINFAAINWLHVPVALASMALVVAMFGHPLLRRRSGDLSAAGRHRHLRTARQCLHLRCHLRPARSLRRAHRLDRDIHGPDRRGPPLRRTTAPHARRDRKSTTPAL